MALSFEQFMASSGAELVGGNLVVGTMSERKKVGTLGDDGVFNLNEDGVALAAELEAVAAGAEKPAKRTKATATDTSAIG